MKQQKGSKKAKPNSSALKRSVVGRDGWRFLLRDVGQTVTIKDYEPVKGSRAFRGSGPHYKGVTRYTNKSFTEKREKILDEALAEFKAGRFIYGDVFVRLCKRHGVKLIKDVKFQCKYMNELDISIRTIRHKNSRGDFKRESFNGIFSGVEFLIAKTLDV